MGRAGFSWGKPVEPQRPLGKTPKSEVRPAVARELAAMGSVVRCGEIGAGNTAKLVNQIIAARNIQGAAEAFTLGRMAGSTYDKNHYNAGEAFL